ncbi:MAG: insulinase family protein [Clostridia bacterium]|nr:insulinase family protein [Clostridia bacterium]
MDLKIGSLINGFRVVRDGDVPLLNAHYWKLIHEATGATLYYSDRDDGQMVFSVGFRTLPEDDTGVFHILEHSCLDGSQSYRLKEPFVNLLKTSMAVDLNAMTFEDKTIYYFISTNEQDYLNLMSVYMDAVFNPLLLTDRRIFEKEAWHIEPAGEGKVAISGVVFNEMQGNDNQPDYIMWMQNEKQLFPDLFFRFNSGGDPAFIPDLTYEQFKATYDRFYSTQNSIFYLSGNMGLEAELAHIDGVLTAKGKSTRDKPAPAPLQAPVVSPDGTVFYQLADNEEIAGNTHLMLTYVLGEDKSAEVLAFALLSRYLAENTESPLTKAVLDAGVGQDFGMACEGDYRQPMLYFTLGKSDPECAEGFRTAVLDTLKKLCEEGIDRERMADLVESHETDCRRASLSVKTGFRIMESFLRAHVQSDDANPVNDLAALRDAMAADDRYFEHLIETYILNSNHWALTKCIPSRTLTEEKRAKMTARFEAEAEKVNATEGGYAALEAKMATFNEYLTAPDSPEAEASVPHLSPADINTTSDARDMAEEIAKVGGCEAKSLSYITDTNGMVMAGLLFDLCGLNEDELFYVRCLHDALMSLPAGKYSVPELTQKWVSLHTNAGLGLRVETTGDAYLAVNLDAPAEMLTEAVALLGEYLSVPVFDRTILSRLFSNASGIRNMMIRRGNMTALRLATRALSLSGVYDEYLSGESAYRRLSELANRFEDNADALIEGMAKVWDKLTKTVAPIAYFTGEQEAYEAWKTAIAGLSTGSAIAPKAACPLALLPRENYALTIPGEVNYCAEVYDLADAGVAFSPKLSVIHTHLYSKCFWDEIRAKGGAYGASAIGFRQGIVGYVSYRDPRVTDTFGVYGGVPAWIEANMPSEEEIGSMIVSTVGSAYFAPRSPIDLGNAALARYLVGQTAADRQAEIETILTTNAEDFKAYAETIRALQTAGKGIKTVLGGVDAVKASGLFEDDRIKEL